MSFVFFIDPMSYNNMGVYDLSLLNNIDIDSDIIFWGNSKFNSSNLLNSNIQFRHVFNYSDKFKLYKIISYFISLLKIIFYSLKYRPKVIHIQWFRLYSLDLIFLKLFKLLHPQIKIIHTSHNLLPHNTGNKYKCIFKRIYKICDSIVVHAEENKKKMIETMNLYPAKINIIPHGLLNYSLNEQIYNSFLSNLKESKEDSLFKFAFMGSINRYKGFDILADTWLNSEFSRNKNIHLYIIGKGDDKNLQNLSTLDNITIINNYVTDEEFEAYMSFIDVVILPYRQISQSGVLLSALTHHKNVIISNVGGLSQPFQVSKVGWILEDISSIDLKNKMEQAIKEYKSINTDWNKIDKYYSWDKIGLITSKLYN